MIDEIYDLSLKRVAKIFGVQDADITMEDRFGIELPTSKTFLSENEMDDIWYDVYFVSDGNVTKELDRNEIRMETVEDYCRHMKRCYLKKPNLVKKTLGIK